MRMGSSLSGCGLLEGERHPGAAAAAAAAAAAGGGGGGGGAFSRAAVANAASSSGVALGATLARRLRRWGLLPFFSGVSAAAAAATAAAAAALPPPLLAGEGGGASGPLATPSPSRQRSHTAARPQAGHVPRVGTTPPPEASWARKRSARHSGWERARQAGEEEEGEEGGGAQGAREGGRGGEEETQGMNSAPGSIGSEQTAQRWDSCPPPPPGSSSSPSPSELDGSRSRGSPSPPGAAAAARFPTTSASTGRASSLMPAGRPRCSGSAPRAEGVIAAATPEESAVTVSGIPRQCGALSIANRTRTCPSAPRVLRCPLRGKKEETASRDFRDHVGFCQAHSNSRALVCDSKP